MKTLVKALLLLMIPILLQAVRFENHGDVKITSITPNVAQINGSTKMTIKGSGFTEESKVVVSPMLSDTSALISTIDTDGTAYGITISGNIAYVADGGAGVSIIDVSDLTNPTTLSTIDTAGWAYGITISGNIAYVADGYEGVSIIDVSDPTNPTTLSTIDTAERAFGITISGNIAYVADARAGVSIIDVSDPTNPTTLSTIDTGSWAYGITISGNIAYVADGRAGVSIINVSDPTNPTTLSTIDTAGYAYGITISGNIVYVADGSEGVSIIDVSDPTNPTTLSTIDTNRKAQGITISGNIAYVADYEAGVSIIDVSDPTNPTTLSTIDTAGWAEGITISGNIAYVADGYKGVSIIDVSDPTNPTTLSTIDTDGEARGITISGNIAYVADGYKRVSIIDVSDPTNPTTLSTIDTDGEARGITISGNIAYVTNGAVVSIIDVSDPTNPTTLSRIYTYSMAYGITISGNIAYLANGGAGVRIIDVSDPTNPTTLSTIDTAGKALDITISGNIAYVADEDEGVSIIDVSDPTNPTTLSTIDTAGWADGITISGNIAYVADYGAGVSIIDVSDPTNPTTLSTIDTAGTAEGITISGNIAYVADYFAGVSIIDVSDPTNPTTLSTIDTDGEARGITISGNIAYVVSNFGFGLVSIIENPMAFTQTTNFIDSNTLEVIFPNFSVKGKYNVQITNDNDNYAIVHGGITLISQEEAQTLPNNDLTVTTYDEIIEIDLKETNAVELNSLLKIRDNYIMNINNIGEKNRFSVATSNKNIAYYTDTNKIFFQSTGEVTITISAKGYSDSIRFKVIDSSNPTTFQDSSKDAIIIIGHLDDKGGELSIDNPYDPLRYSINRIGNNIYKTLSMFGIDKDHIQYFNPNGKQELVDHDNDKVKDNAVDHIDFTWNDVVSTLNSLDSSSTDPVILWMVDHGSTDQIKIGANQTVTTTQIKEAIDNFQTNTGRTVITILDACYSGSIANAIKKDNRVIISSSDSTSVTYMDTFGISFSHYLLKYLKRGDSIKDSFEKAKEAYNKKLAKNNVSINPLYSNQTSLAKKLYSTIPNPTDDDYTLSDFNIGNGEPLFLDYTGKDNNIILTSNSLELQVKTDHPYPSLAKLYALITPPDPVEDVGTAKIVNTQMLELYIDNDGYSKNMYNFNTKGDYTVTYVLEDDDGNSYISDTAIVTQTISSDENKTSNTITLSAGWNLVALDSDLDDLNDTTIIWQYDDKWKAYSPNKQLQTIVNNTSSIDTITESINSTNGTWILSDAVQYLDTHTITASSNKTYQSGWNLAGTNTTINTKEIECSNSTVNSIWKYKNNSWMLRTDKPNTFNLYSFDTIKANEGFWVHCK
jgi:hypothetical protein